ncbi:hypothetical protein PAXINDRAFT_23589, partial [Paxillus involutus ATCC 200175]
NYRSVWSILASCGLTLLICTWHAIHPNIVFQETWYTVALYRGGLVLSVLLAPELTIARASDERWDASDHQWTRTHGFFALMGGFVLQDGTRRTELVKRRALQHLRSGTIMNLNITEAEINDRSKSDGLGKAILVIQLSWFILQIVARGMNHLAITLLEIDTLAMAALSFLLFFFWWSKPMAPGRPHTFYLMPTSMLRDAREIRRFVVIYGLQALIPRELRARTFVGGGSILSDIWREEIVGGRLGSGEVDRKYGLSALLIVWVIFGALHLIAWDFQFPSQAEKIIWRVASLTLVASPCVFFLTFKSDFMAVIALFVVCIGVVARVVLLVVMLASLRYLPASAYQTVSWTSYVPHL